MKKCIHQYVCGYKVKDFEDENVCTATTICKFYSEGNKLIGGGAHADAGSKPKRHYKKRAKSDTIKSDDVVDIGDCVITEKQFKKARKKIANAQQFNQLNDNQALALKSLKGIRFSVATTAQKEQIINMANDLWKKK